MKGNLKSKKTQHRGIQRVIEKSKNYLPVDFEVIDLVVNGKQVLLNLKEIIELTDCQDKNEIMSAMNKMSTYYFYFGRVVIDLEDALQDQEEEFEIWLASKMSKVSGDSEKARERVVKVKYSTAYKEKKNAIRTTSRFVNQAKIAKNSLDKNMSMLQSIGAFLRSEKDKSDKTNTDLSLE